MHFLSRYVYSTRYLDSIPVIEAQCFQEAVCLENIHVQRI